jgi:secreted trypsin-like serine protease
MMWAGDDDADACNGDCGGPLMVPRGDEMMLMWSRRGT